jgi:hypothetical protein
MGEEGLEQRIPPRVKVGELVVLVDDVDGVEAGREGCIMGVRDNVVTVAANRATACNWSWRAPGRFCLGSSSAV